jgi:hypothetical protein
MGKILGSWSGMRKYLEEEMIAQSIRGRVRYGCTRYVGMDNCHIFDVSIDGIQVKRFSWETVNSYFIEQGLSSNSSPFGVHEYLAGFWETLEKYPMSMRTEYTDEEFCTALEKYRNSDIRESIISLDPIVRMFAVLDRRIGKRTIEALNVSEQPLWLQPFYELRKNS